MTQQVIIGIYFDEDPQRLTNTLSSIHANTIAAHRTAVLDESEGSAAAQSNIPLLQGTKRGAAASFNRLIASAEADIYVFLEAGCIVGPGWFDTLLAALDSDPRNGLAGPSTNRAWNQQCAFPNATGTLQEVDKTARLALQRYGSTSRTLEPLFSLSDFCYAVKREVVDAVGAADETYGAGPCWEMDYNIRAHRAGFRSVWACGSYVYRAPFSARRAQAEASNFLNSRHRYQDKFCGLRLSGSTEVYKPHCRGDACTHFAPRDLVEVHLPLQAPAVSAPKLSENTRPFLVRISSTEDMPLVSCIMVTRNRSNFVQQSIRYFQRQDYANRELIILDDGNADLSSLIGNDERIRYIKLRGPLTIGAKRNRGCELARGTYVAHWDDDDWYAPDRLSKQLAPLLNGTADISALRADIFFDLPRWKFWQCTSALHRRLFVEDVHGGTLVYKRSCWVKFARYPEVSIAEDALFLRQAIRRGARLARLANDGAFIYLRHQANAWAFECGKYLDAKGWLTATEPTALGDDRAFYAKLSPNAPAALPVSSQRTLVSCIMPTANRRFLVPQAIRYFLNQDYPNRELIIVDDGDDGVADLVPANANIRNVRLSRRHTIGAKRNIACDEARGEIIVHWDDDDWMASWRLSYQVEALSKATGSAVCGLANILYYDPLHQRAWSYVYPERQRPWVAGNTLCYRKELWRKHPFSDVDEGEDTRFIWSVPQCCILALPDSSFYVATVHERNSSRKRTHDTRWFPKPVEEIERLLGADLSFYRSSHWTKDNCKELVPA